jgi:hypothetical protein
VEQLASVAAMRQPTASNLTGDSFRAHAKITSQWLVTCITSVNASGVADLIIPRTIS